MKSDNLEEFDELEKSSEHGESDEKPVAPIGMAVPPDTGGGN